MSFSIIRAAIAAERDSTLHEARLLLLIWACSKERDGAIEGITKLAKLDFFLRYPTYFEKVVQKIRRRPPAVPMQEYERATVESKMIRFRYGPWDPRYREWIGVLAAKGLILARPESRSAVHLTLTEKGKIIADGLASLESFSDLANRSLLVSHICGGLSGNKLKEYVYEVVPELGQMDWGEEIQP